MIKTAGAFAVSSGAYPRNLVKNWQGLNLPVQGWKFNFLGNFRE